MRSTSANMKRMFACSLLSLKHQRNHRSVNSILATKSQCEQQFKKTEKTDEKRDVDWAECPLCGAAVKRRHLKRHMRRAHRLALSPSTKPKPMRITKRISPEEARELRRANQDSLVSDQAIADYLKRFPVHEEIGKFGVPQDKYRWGFYGSRTMEFNAWRRS